MQEPQKAIKIFRSIVKYHTQVLPANFKRHKCGLIRQIAPLKIHITRIKLALFHFLYHTERKRSASHRNASRDASYCGTAVEQCFIVRRFYEARLRRMKRTCGA